MFTPLPAKRKEVLIHTGCILVYLELHSENNFSEYKHGSALEG
jgi:hypothetical protein